MRNAVAPAVGDNKLIPWYGVSGVVGRGASVEVIEGRGKKELGKVVNEEGCIGWRADRATAPWSSVRGLHILV